MKRRPRSRINGLVMQTLLEVLDKTARFFEAKGLENPRLNAELLFAHVLECKRLDLYLRFEQPMSEGILDTLRPLVARRSRREPLQYIIGETDFFNSNLKIDDRALIPRPESEEMVEMVTGKLTESPQSILDLGTGSGALALALARHYPQANVLAVDNCARALELANENIAAAGLAGRVETILSNWFERLEGKYSLIISNPPYLGKEEWESAQPEVREHEPRTALVAENSGLADLEKIIEGVASFLSPEGLVALETGPEQHGFLTEIAAKAGFSEIESKKDLGGRDRFLFLRRREPT